MADQDTRALLLTIQANTELLRSNLSAAERSIEDFTNKTKAHLDASDKRFEMFGHSLEKLEAPLERLKALGEVAIGALLGESLIEAGKKGLEFAGNVQFVSEQVGTSTDFLQKYRFAAGQFGVGTQEADQGLNKFARSIGEAANGNKSLIELFDKLHVNIFSMVDGIKQVRSVESIFGETATAISKIDNPAQKSADTLQLMGKGASGLIPLLSAGADGFNNLAQQAQALGVVLSPELIEHSEQVNHKLAALKGIVDAQLSSAIAQNAGSIEVLATAFVKLAGGISQFLSGHPERALTILGALAGSRVGGLPGAAIGAIVGNIAGGAIGAQNDEDNNDVTFRKKALRDAAQAYILAHNTPTSEDGGYGASRGGGPAQDTSQTEASARTAYLHQRELYQRSLHAPRPTEGGLGSDGAGATNDNGEALKAAQARLAALQEQRAHASGAALTAINQKIVEQNRKIGFIKQGADAELAGSLASETGAAERKGESEAKSAARKAEEARLKAIEEDRAYLGEIAQADQAIARARLKLADTADARYQIAVQELRDALAQKDGQIDDEVRAGKRTAEQGLTLKVAAGSAEQLGEQGAGRDLANSTITATANLAQDEFQRTEAHLQVLDQLATTTRARRDIELRLLTVQEEAERQALQTQKDTTTDLDAQKRIQKQIDALPDAYADKHQTVIANTRGPGEQFAHDLNSKDINDELQNVKIGGLNSLEEGLTGLVTGTTSVSSAFKNMAQSIIADLARIAIEKLVIGSVAPLLGLKDGGLAVPRFADGGVNGQIRGPGGPRSDSILIAASNGEFIVNAEATKRNLSLLHAINDNRLPRFADGGPISPSVAIAPRINLAAIGAARANAMQPTYQQHFHINAAGAILASDIIAETRRMGIAATVGGARMAEQNIAETQHQVIP